MKKKSGVCQCKDFDWLPMIFIIYELEKYAFKSDSKGIVWTFPGVDESK